MSAHLESLTRPPRRTVILIGAATLLVPAGIYGLAGGFGLPLLLRDALAGAAAKIPGMQVTLGRVSFNPWTLTLTARRFTVRDAAHTLIDVDEMRVGVNLSSLWRRAIVVKEVELEGASLFM